MSAEPVWTDSSSATSSVCNNDIDNDGTPLPPFGDVTRARADQDQDQDQDQGKAHAEPRPSKNVTYVQKRDGSFEPVQFDKINQRILNLSADLHFLNPYTITQNVIQNICDGITTSRLDELTAEDLAYRIVDHPEFGILASRIVISNLHKQLAAQANSTRSRAAPHNKVRFSDVVERLADAATITQDKRMALLSDKFLEIARRFADRFDAWVDLRRDYLISFFGFKTLERSYLLRINKKVAEAPQHLYMRIAIGIHIHDDFEHAPEATLESIRQTYEALSQHYYTHASPTMFHAGTPFPQLSSCFLLVIPDDSIDGICAAQNNIAFISKYGGGSGMSIHNIRSEGTYIHGTNGRSNGIVPMLRVFNETVRYIDQGGGKRKGAAAIYLEPWHADIFAFLDIRKNHGKEEHRARDLFPALWIPDLFMERVKNNETWSLFSADTAPGLYEVYGDEFRALYEQYERDGRALSTVPAMAIWTKILEAQEETGTPYMLYKDACNRKSNQKNLGTIRSSNLCTEIIEYSSPDETAVCNLASVSLSAFVVTPGNDDDATTKHFDFAKLGDVVRLIVRNLNRVIDVNFYPIESARRSNLKHRPMGIGVQGLADCFQMMGLQFTEPRARQLNREIFEVMYYHALDESANLAAAQGPYESFAGSPLSEGKFQFDLWRDEGTLPETFALSLGEAAWDALRDKIKRVGVRHSLMFAPMPTASTAQILGNQESIEPYTSNLYTRRVLAGEYVCINQHLQRDLFRRGLWSEDVQQDIVRYDGSVQNIVDLPDDLKAMYRTVWEIPQKQVVDMAVDRAPFICQSQSLNIHMKDPTPERMSSLHMYTWKKGLKTGMYYLRTRPRANPAKFTVSSSSSPKSKSNSNSKPSTQACSLKNDDNECMMCSA